MYGLARSVGGYEGGLGDEMRVVNGGRTRKVERVGEHEREHGDCLAQAHFVRVDSALGVECGLLLLGGQKEALLERIELDVRPVDLRELGHREALACSPRRDHDQWTRTVEAKAASTRSIGMRMVGEHGLPSLIVFSRLFIQASAFSW